MADIELTTVPAETSVDAADEFYFNDVSETPDALNRATLANVLGAALNTVRGLSPSNDDFLQRKSGAWANRTIAQVQADIITAAIITGQAEDTTPDDANDFVLTYDASATALKKVKITNLGGGGGGTPGGANTQVQFNDASAFGGDAGFTYDKGATQLKLTSGSAANIPFVVQQHATSPTGDFAQFLAGDGTTKKFRITSNGWLQFGNNATYPMIAGSGSGDVGFYAGSTTSFIVNADGANYFIDWRVAGGNEGRFNSTALTPKSDGGLALGTSVWAWSALFTKKVNQRTSAAADPTTTEYPNDKDWGIHKNTSSGSVFLAYNDSGTIKKVALT